MARNKRTNRVLGAGTAII